MQLGAFCPIGYIVYCYHEFKLRYLKNQKLFSIRVKKLLEPIVLWKKNKNKNKNKKGDGFLLFLKAFSWETNLWVTLGDFTVKNAKLGKEICISWKSKSWNEMWCAADNHFFFFFFFFAGGVAIVLQHRYFIQETLCTGTICSHGYGFDIHALITAFRKTFFLKPTTPESSDWLIRVPQCNKNRDQGKILAEREAKLEQGPASTIRKEPSQNSKKWWASKWIWKNTIMKALSCKYIIYWSW